MMIKYEIESHFTTEYIVVVTGASDGIRECVAKCGDEVMAKRIARELTAEHKRAVIGKFQTALKAQLCWIPVGERLPEEGKMVNFSLNSSLRTIYKGWWESGDNLKDGNDMWYGESNQQWFSMNEVALWCAIPPLPEEAQND